MRESDRGESAGEVRLITLDPGHFHAALVQREMYDDVDPRVHVYAPLGPDLVAHLGRIARFNTRRERPTSWQLEVHTGPDGPERLLRERPGNVVVLSGRNRGKIDHILAAVRGGLNVLADKPWVLVPEDLPRLEEALDIAGEKGLIAYDIMTERHEITSVLQKELVNDAGTFGTVVAGTEREPGVTMESVHHLMKTVAGVPNLRPAWFFDIHEQGEGLTDVGTHLVDLVPWVLFPGQPLDYRTDFRVLAARRWPTVLTGEEFLRVTGEADFPEELRPGVREGRLEYFCNSLVSYTVRGIHTRLSIRWDYEATAGAGDTHFAAFLGTRSRVEVRQGREQGYRPEVYVVPNRPGEKDAILAAARRKMQSLQARFAGVAVEEVGGEFLIRIPDVHRVGHEASFARLTNQFLGYLKAPRSLPAWEKPNMVAKYHVTTRGVALSRQAG